MIFQWNHIQATGIVVIFIRRSMHERGKGEKNIRLITS